MLSETTIAILAAAALEVAAIALAGGLAYWGVVRQMGERRKLQKQTNSINVMLTLCSDRDLYDASRVVSEIEDDPDDSSEKYAHPLPQKLSAEDKEAWLRKRSALRALVNFFEMVSVGIRENIYDEAIIRGCARAMFVKNHERTERFILKMRKESNTYSYGENFQRIAEKFAAPNTPPQ